MGLDHAVTVQNIVFQNIWKSRSSHNGKADVGKTRTSAISADAISTNYVYVCSVYIPTFMRLYFRTICKDLS